MRRVALRLGSPTTSCTGFALAGQIATLTVRRRVIGETDLDHPGELDGSGCCFLLRIPRITTDMTAPVKNEMSDLYEAVVARTPAGRFGEPAECAGAAVFLASEAANFVTGQAIAVCGGYSIS